MTAIAGISALFVALFVVRVVGCALVRFGKGPHEREFDSHEWKSGWTCRCTPIRQQMARDLVESRVLLGAARSRVVELLGEADDDPYLLVEQPRWTGALIYVLGPDHLGMDHEWLVVNLDPVGAVTDALVVAD